MADILISVRGEAERRVSPEVAIVSAAATADGPERTDVVSRVTATVAPLRTRLEELTRAGTVSDWSSGSVSTWSERPWNAEGNQLAPVHHATIDLRATFDDFVALAEWVSRLADDEGMRVSNIEWQLSPATRATVERDVATSAVGVAVARASAYATALGRASVEPVEIADIGLLHGADAPPSAPLFARAATMSADASSGGVELRPAEIVVTAAVEARFRAL
ncbi:SIMPL domain-containing protein [Microbacterium sp. 2P01SA-2]|uniref:SIMPL domain-containing protein n=1 Tax=unclassified Microbacterium TaxID=2609290 RepID=UPI0039A34466